MATPEKARQALVAITATFAMQGLAGGAEPTATALGADEDEEKEE
jgi:hypothetical protein